jgi:hypothetical protein
MVARLWEAGPEAGPDGSTLASLKALTEEARLRAHAPPPRRRAAPPGGVKRGAPASGRE